MFISFEKIQPLSRIWIYQSNRPFNSQEELLIREMGQQFVENWTSHQNSLAASFEILYHLFIVFAVDESVAGSSGCSIDKSFAFIRQLEKEFSVSLLDRKAVAFEKNDRILCTSIHQFGQMLKEGEVNEQTITFNNLTDTKAAMENNWRIPLKDSWLMQVI